MVRAYSLRHHVLESIFKDPAPNWDLIAAKLEEVVQALPWSSSTATLLGNAQLRLDRREQAIAAYEHALREAVAADPMRPDLTAQLTRLRSGEPLSAIPPLRSSLLE
jgi:cytochrome c-type biogenesis protein CcmH/NrfG